MQLTRQEVLESQLLVTTPEKYDVVTRKGGDGSLGTLVNLIIIDEVHLLAEDRGAVLETIVARTQRYIESSQHMVRPLSISIATSHTHAMSFVRYLSYPIAYAIHQLILMCTYICTCTRSLHLPPEHLSSPSLILIDYPCGSIIVVL
jgi:superfamily II helicase